MTDWVMVPREPTDEMVAAGFEVHPCFPGQTKVSDAYRAMLAAAPQQTAEPQRIGITTAQVDEIKLLADIYAGWIAGGKSQEEARADLHAALDALLAKHEGGAR